MRRHAARGNRIGLTLLGLALLAAGAALAARSAGLYGGPATMPVYPPAAHRYIHAHGWIWPAAAAAAVIIALACLRWLFHQPRRGSLRRLRIGTGQPTGSSTGRTILLATALTGIIEDDLTGQPGIRRAAASLSGHPDQPQLWLAITATAGADLARLASHLTGELLPGVRTTLGQPTLTATLRITTTRRQPQTQSPAVVGENGPSIGNPQPR